MAEHPLMARARQQAARYRHKYIRSEHLLLALTEQPDAAVARYLRRAGVDHDALAGQVAALRRPVCAADEQMVLAAAADRALQAAREYAGQADPPPLSVLYGVLRMSPLVRRILSGLGADPAALLEQLEAEGAGHAADQQQPQQQEAENNHE